METKTHRLPAKSRRGRRKAISLFWRISIIMAALLYFGALVLVPIGSIYYNTFKEGFAPFWESINEPNAVHAAKLTLLITAIVVPINTLFGLGAAWLLSREKFIGRTVISALANVPLAISPIIAGLYLVLVYSPTIGLLKPVVNWLDFKILFATPGLVLATLFITLPYVMREVLPSLDAFDKAEEQAAYSLGATRWQTFWRVVFPAIRWSVIYGLIICIAKSVGEFGAVSGVSGKLIGETNTLTLHVERTYMEYETLQAYSASTLLTTVALITVVLQLLIPTGQPGAKRH